MAESPRKRGSALLVVCCLIAAVVILGISFMSGSGTEFGGTDAAVTESLESDGYTPWFHPLFELGSGELESGLFAIQAALGAGVVGFVLGSLRERRRREDTVASTQQSTVGKPTA